MICQNPRSNRHFRKFSLPYRDLGASTSSNMADPPIPRPTFLMFQGVSQFLSHALSALGLVAVALSSGAESLPASSLLYGVAPSST